MSQLTPSFEFLSKTLPLMWNGSCFPTAADAFLHYFLSFILQHTRALHFYYDLNFLTCGIASSLNTLRTFLFHSSTVDGTTHFTLFILNSFWKPEFSYFLIHMGWLLHRWTSYIYIPLRMPHNKLILELKYTAFSRKQGWRYTTNLGSVKC